MVSSHAIDWTGKGVHAFLAILTHCQHHPRNDESEGGGIDTGDPDLSDYH